MVRSQTELSVLDARSSLGGKGRGVGDENGMPATRLGRQGGHVVEMQRRRLLSATVDAVFERGAPGLSVALVCQRAGVSRRTFYEIFEDRDSCLLAAFEEAVGRVSESIESAVAGAKSWTDGVRAGLLALLSFLDREPATGRLVIVEALAAGAPTLDARRRVLARLVDAVDTARAEAKIGREPPPLTAEGIVGAVFSVIHARMLEVDARPLSELTRPLMALIVQPYLGHGAARRELERIPPPATCPTPALTKRAAFKDLPIRFTYRTARVLSSIAAAPGASNKQIATASGVSDEGQMSRLLARLQKADLVRNMGGEPAKGEARSWRLTERGEAVLEVVG